MIKLLKYEFQRKWKVTFGLLIAYFIVYFGFLIKFKSEGTYSIESFGFQLIFFILLGSALSFGSIVGAVNSLRLEAKQSTRDLYFSIPMSAYAKIGSKVMVSVAEVFTAGFIAIYTAVKAIEHLTGVTLWKPAIKEILSQPMDQLIFAIIGNLVYAVLMILVVYLSFAIFRSFFSQVKFGGIITIVIYIFLNYLLVKGGTAFFETVDETSLEGLALWMMLAGFTAFTASVYLLIGFLFEKRVSFD
ncbi:MAG: hypothetical protein JEZ08_14740 [Clostridiales bacterium]|nr:hypothetical protein [Clostridiales bacterium]